MRYSRDGSYHFRMVVDVPHNRYSVWYEVANQPEQLLASDFQFRGNPVTLLDYWMARMDEASPPNGGLEICNVRVGP